MKSRERFPEAVPRISEATIRRHGLHDKDAVSFRENLRCRGAAGRDRPKHGCLYARSAAALDDRLAAIAQRDANDLRETAAMDRLCVSQCAAKQGRGGFCECLHPRTEMCRASAFAPSVTSAQVTSKPSSSP